MQKSYLGYNYMKVVGRYWFMNTYWVSHIIRPIATISQVGIFWYFTELLSLSQEYFSIFEGHPVADIHWLVLPSSYNMRTPGILYSMKYRLIRNPAIMHKFLKCRLPGFVTIAETVKNHRIVFHDLKGLTQRKSWEGEVSLPPSPRSVCFFMI